MSRYVIFGVIKEDSAIYHCVYGDLANGRLPDATFLDLASVCRANRMRQFMHRGGALVRRALRRIPGMKRRIRRNATTAYWEIDDAQIRECASSEEQTIFLFALPPINRYMSKYLVDDLRKKYPRSKMIRCLSDSVDLIAQRNRSSVEEYLNRLHMYDAVYTYNRRDAELYADSMKFMELPIRHSDEKAPETLEADLYFCGRDNNRGEMLYAIRQRLSQDKDLRCRMRIIPVEGFSNSQDEESASAWIPYSQYLEEMLASNCILEVLSQHTSESTLRYKEAVIYNKKLLTNNPNTAELPYYDPRWMRRFESPEDIDMEWVKAVEPVDYGYKGDFSLDKYLRRIEELAQ